MNERDHHLDFFKALALINMFVYHFIFDMQTFKIIDYNIFTDTKAIIWRVIIVSTFLICVGISLVLVSKRLYVKRAFYLKSDFQLLIASFLVSIVTYLVFPNQWIYFGILHFILVSRYLLFPFIKSPKISLFMGILIIVLFFIFGFWNPFIYLSIDFLPSYSLDMINFIPWLAFIFFGIFLGHYPFYKKIVIWKNRKFLLIGRYSLFFYLLHQVVLFPLAYLISKII